MRSILCLTPSSLAFVLGGAHFWLCRTIPRFPSAVCCSHCSFGDERRGYGRSRLCCCRCWPRAGCGRRRSRAAPHVHGTAVDAAGVHPARRVAVYRHGGPVAGRKDGGCMVCARQEEGAHADGGLFRDDLHPDAAAFRRTAGFPDGAFPARMGAAPYPACRVLGLVGGIAAWGQGCRAAYALIHLVPVLGGLFRTARPRPCRIRPVPHDREPSSPRAGHDPRGPAIPWRRAVHAHSVRRLRTAGRGCVVQPPVLFRGLG